MIQILENNITFKLGKNAKENFELIDEAVDINPEFWWFHLEDHPSGHCLVHSEQMDKQMAQIAGSLVKSNSKLKDQKKVKIIYTQVKNIKKTKTLGEVILLNKPMIITL